MTGDESTQFAAMRRDIAHLTDAVRKLELTVATVSTRLEPEALNNRIDNRITVGLRESRNNQQGQAGLWITSGIAVVMFIITLATLVSQGSL